MSPIVMPRPPGSGTGLELPSFIRLGRLAADGYHLVGGVGQYEGTWGMASVRGPEGFIVNLPQPVN